MLGFSCKLRECQVVTAEFADVKKMYKYEARSFINLSECARHYNFFVN